MSGALKKTLVALLTKPAGWHDTFWEPIGRIWRMARARARIKIGTSCVLTGQLHILGRRQVSIGEQGYFYRDIHLETQENGRIQIGDGVVLSSGVHLVSFYSITVEKGAMIGEFTSVRDANHAPGDNYRESGHVGKPIHIGANVWIGRGCCILPGVTIGANSIIGANSVVTRSVPADSVALGTPARIVKIKGEKV